MDRGSGRRPAPGAALGDRSLGERERAGRVTDLPQQLTIEQSVLRLVAHGTVGEGITSSVFAWRKLVRAFGPRQDDRCSRATFQSVAAALADHADRHGGSCFPAVATLAAETGLSRRSVQYALRALEGWQLIRHTNAGMGGRARSTRWQLWDPLPSQKGARADLAEKGADGLKGAPDDTKRAHPVHPRSVIEVRIENPGSQAAS